MTPLWKTVLQTHLCHQDCSHHDNQILHIPTSPSETGLRQGHRRGDLRPHPCRRGGGEADAAEARGDPHVAWSAQIQVKSVSFPSLPPSLPLAQPYRASVLSMLTAFERLLLNPVGSGLLCPTQHVCLCAHCPRAQHPRAGERRRLQCKCTFFLPFSLGPQAKLGVSPILLSLWFPINMYVFYVHLCSCK